MKPKVRQTAIYVSGNRVWEAQITSIHPRLLMCAAIVAHSLLVLTGCGDQTTRSELRNTLPPPQLTFERAKELTTAQSTPFQDASTNARQSEASTAVSPVVDIGTGSVIGRPRTARATPTVDGDIILNFVDASIDEVARAIIADTLHQNYVVDPEVTGSVTLHTSRPLAIEELPALLESVLLLNEAALVVEGDLYRIVPAGIAVSAGINPIRFPRRDAAQAGFGLYVVPLNYVSAIEIEALLRPFVPAGSIAQIDQTRNVLLVSGPAEQVATVLDLVDMFDVDWLSGMSIALYPLFAVDPEIIAGELETLFNGAAGNSLDGIVRFVPISRLQAIMVITSQPQYLNRVKRWIDELDRGTEGDGSRVYIYHVQYGLADTLAECSA